MFCTQCGAQAEEGTKSCGKCGAPLQTGARQSQPPRYQAFSPVSQNETSPRYEGTENARFAGFWIRFVATLVDAIILMIPSFILLMLLSPDSLSGTESEDSASYQAVSFALWLLYKAGMESSSKQATLGKMLVGIKVTDLNGNRISFGRAIGRYFAQILSSLILFIGFIMAAFTAKKQALHDMIAGTYVSYKQ